MNLNADYIDKISRRGSQKEPTLLLRSRHHTRLLRCFLSLILTLAVSCTKESDVPGSADPSDASDTSDVSAPADPSDASDNSDATDPRDASDAVDPNDYICFESRGTCSESAPCEAPYACIGGQCLLEVTCPQAGEYDPEAGLVCRDGSGAVVDCSDFLTSGVGQPDREPSVPFPVLGQNLPRPPWAGSIGDDSEDEDPCEGARVAQGCACESSYGCESGLVCYEGLCREPSAQWDVGGAGEPCYDNGTCDTSATQTLTCIQGFCIAQELRPEGSVGGACRPNATPCDDVEGVSLVCQDGVCTPSGCAPGDLGCACRSNGQCGFIGDEALICSQAGVCVAGSCLESEPGSEGCLCGAQGCADGLLCDGLYCRSGNQRRLLLEGAAGARSCQVRLRESGSLEVRQVAYRAEFEGVMRTRSPLVALAWVWSEDVERSEAEVATLHFDRPRTRPLSGLPRPELEIERLECFDDDGHPLRGARLRIE